MLGIIYYNDNPNLRLVKVVTHCGKTEYLKNCKKLEDGFYYVKGVDLKPVGDKWVRIHPLKEVYDHELKKQNSAEGLIFGIVDILPDGKEALGYYSPNLYKNGKLLDKKAGVEVQVLDVAALPANLYVECVANGVYYRRQELTREQIKGMQDKERFVNFHNQPYCAEDSPKLFKQAIDLYKNSDIKVDKDLKYLSRYLNGITFGAEIETINGTLPPHLLAKYGIIICKDGSIRNGAYYPPEYVTVPLSGAKGLQVLRDIPVEIAKRSDINVQCSYHLHLGGIEITRLFIVALYKLCCKIQGDVFKMFPGYKIHYKNIKEKNYCKQLPKLLTDFGSRNFNDYVNRCFTDIYSFLTGGKVFDIDFNRKNKNNPWGANKWQCETRYYWVNFVNPFFGKRDTIEFRLHTPTLNPDKIINWLLMCVAIVRYAQTYTKKCTGADVVTFKDVLNFYSKVGNGVYGANLSERLIQYYDERVAYFAKDLANKDIISNNELVNDGNYKFPITKFN